MARLRENPGRKSALAALCLAMGLSLMQGCARSEPLHRSDAGPPAGAQKLPFHPETDRASASDGAQPAVPLNPTAGGGMPFRSPSYPRILPSGTLLTVQLEGPLSAATVRAGDAFTASVAAPLTLEGETLIEPGAAVTGRVESAQSQPDSGYFRLTLNTITVAGRSLALQTSSLFARGVFPPSNGSSRGSPSDMRADSVLVPKGRRLTFRLTSPVTLDDPRAVASRQSPSPATE